MDEDIQRRIEDLYNRSIRTNQPIATAFLDPAELAVSDKVLKRIHACRYVVYGGYTGAERSRIIFLPDYLDESDFTADEYISVLRAQCKFAKPIHRDWLGSIMGLGVKRETIGDILVCDGYTDIICTDKISQYLQENLDRVGRLGVELKKISTGEIIAPEPEYDVREGTVASPRADSVVSLAFGISRTAAVGLIKEGRLSVNHLPQLSPSAEIAEGELISLRGYGRARLSRMGGMSKKGRIFLTMHVFSKK